MTALANTQIQQYQQQGYLSPLSFLGREEARDYRQYFESVEQNPEYHNFSRPIEKYLRTGAQLVVPVMTEIASKPAILDQVASILGPNLLLYSAELFIKEARTEAFVSWHQDLTYWGLGETDQEVTAWIALSEASVDAGCMRFIPGSHKKHIISHSDSFAGANLLSRGQVVDATIDESDAVHVSLRPGQFSLHHDCCFTHQRLINQQIEELAWRCAM